MYIQYTFNRTALQSPLLTLSTPMAPPVNLSLSHLRLQPLPYRHLRPVLASSCFPSNRNRTPKPRMLHPRDIQIEIGRYKGRRLGTLPSSYLKWLSQSVDPEPSLSYWSELATLVLQDPVYQDRVEWEPALRLFTGEGLKGNFFQNESFDVMKAYREIGERFGWDMDNKEAWSMVNRELIGTSFSGRIPRKKKEERGELAVPESVKSEESDKKGGLMVGGKRGERIERMRLKREKVPVRIEEKGEVKEKVELGYLDNQNGVDNGKKAGFLVGKKRGEIIGRMRLRREKIVQMVKSDVVVEEEILEEKKEAAPRITIKKERVSRGKGDLERRERELGAGINDEMINVAKRVEKSGNVESFNPFPGRDALFDKIRRRKDLN